MLTYKLRIKEADNNSFIKQKQQMYSYAFRKLYKNFNKISNKKFKVWVCKQFELDSWDWASLIIDVKMKISQVNIYKRKLQNKISYLRQQLNKLQNLKATTSRQRMAFKLSKKINYFKKLLEKDIVFGTKQVLKLVSKKDSNYQQNKLLYLKNRLLPITSVGDADKNGNRKFKLDIQNNTINYNQNRNTKIKISIFTPKNWRDNLLKIQQLSNDKKLPVTYKLTTEYVYVTFDESILNGYKINNKLFIKGDKQHNRQVFKAFENIKTQNKIKNRYCGIDLNPQYIGFSICEKQSNNSIKQLYKQCIDLTTYSNKLSVNSSNKLQLYQNNKRRYEIYESWKHIFKLCSHYKVCYVITEQLNFNNSNLGNNVANKKCKNIWHRQLTKNLISKYCNILGITNIQINPCYTSFIGNIQYNNFDPVNASLEICRRGIFKYEKGKFYPEITKKDVFTMSKLIKYQLRDENHQNVVNFLNNIQYHQWSEWFILFHKTRFRYRQSLDKSNYRRFSLKSNKSKVFLYIF